MPRPRERLGALLAVPKGRDARIYAVAAVVDALGNSLFLPVSALFFVNVVGLSTSRVGIGLSVAGVVGMLGPLLSGPPVDRFGPRRVVLVQYLVRAAAYACYPLVRGFWAFVALVSVTAIADHLAHPALQALAASLTDERDRVTTMAFVRSVRNIGWGVGGLLVALALAIGGRGPYVVLVLADAATFVVAAALLLRVADVRVPPPEGPPTGYRTVLRDRRFVALAVLRGILTLHLAVLLIGFPLWIDQRTNAPTAVAGVVFAVNSVIVVLFQVTVSRRASTVAAGGRSLRASGYALALTCVLLALTPDLPRWPAAAALVAIGAVECLAEMTEGAGGWAVSLGLAPDHARGRYLGVWEVGFGLNFVIGPLVVTSIVEHAGRVGWLGLAAVVATAGALASHLARDAEQPLPQRLDAVDGRVDDGGAG